MSHDDKDTRYLQPYPSASPTSGAQSASSSNSRGDDNGPFGPANTPPLVFAFIAIGFVVFGLVIAIIYKKCRPLPNSPHPHSSIPIRRPSAQKPGLWDVWIAPHHRVSDDDHININDWDTFLPLSASLVYPYNPSPPIRVPQRYAQGYVARPISWETPEQRLFRRPPQDASLHVAVVISMPTQTRTFTETELHVGVTEAKWTG